ncbi:MAG: hypothetical protein J5706_00435, partial [Elusimicrobiales bacterium]|nr:hypothetical protein [Elusimicrobiales bacterium]
KNEDVNIALKRIDQLLSQKGQNLQQEKPAAKNAADNKIQASQYYLEGLKYFGNAEYEKAKNVWTKAHQLDPYNEDVVNGLKRVEHLLGK